MLRKHESLHDCRFLVIYALFAFGTSVLHAQEPATSLEQLNLLMGEGDKITLVDSTGEKTSGKLHRVTQEGIDLVVRGRVKNFSEKDIQRITRKRPDSPLNGFLIGTGIGFGATLPLCVAYANSEGINMGLAVVNSALWGLVGGGIGALVDASIHEKQLVYVRKERAVSWSISPLFSELQQYPAPGTQNFLVGSPSHSSIQSPKGLAVNVRF